MLRNTDAGPWTLSLIIILSMGTGCVAHTFNSPVTVSTDSAVVKNVTRLGPIKSEHCARSILLFIPLSIVDPRDGYDDLLAEAQAKGGNTVVDFQLRSTSTFAFIPLYQHGCMEFTGVAAKM